MTSAFNTATDPRRSRKQKLLAGIWSDVNDHLGTSATSMAELVEQLGIMRFGHRPKVADTFAGGGSIPFEAARLGYVYASDLNPIACMLTWGALNIIGADEETRERIEVSQREVAAAVDAEIVRLGIEHDGDGLGCVSAWRITLPVPQMPSSSMMRTMDSLMRMSAALCHAPGPDGASPYSRTCR